MSLMTSELLLLLKEYPPIVPDPRYKCIICLNLLLDACQTICGCFGCEECLKKLLSTNKTPCPGKTEDCESLTMHDYRADNAKRREVLFLSVSCPFSIRCEEMIRVMDLQEHNEKCEFIKISCPSCGTLLLRRELQSHMEESCLESDIKCKFCSKLFSRRDLKIHCDPLNEKCCESYQSNDCPFCKKIGPFTLADLKTHSKVCPSWCVSCIYNQLGCDAVLLESDMDKHCFEKETHHMNLMAKTVLECQRLINNVQTMMKSIETSVHGRDQPFYEQHLRMAEALDRLASSNVTIQQFSSTDENQVSLSSLKYSLEEMQALEWASKQFYWKIEKIDDLTENIESQKFYSPELPGYLVKLKLYFESECLCADIGFAPGTFDAILNWPFDEEMHITLRSRVQTGNNFVKVVSFRDLPTENRYRPILGQPAKWNKTRLVNLTTLRNSYLRNNTLYLTCIIKYARQTSFFMTRS
jgi:hypothetical protein